MAGRFFYFGEGGGATIAPCTALAELNGLRKWWIPLMGINIHIIQFLKVQKRNQTCHDSFKGPKSEVKVGMTMMEFFMQNEQESRHFLHNTKWHHTLPLSGPRTPIRFSRLSVANTWWILQINTYMRYCLGFNKYQKTQKEHWNRFTHIQHSQLLRRLPLFTNKCNILSKFRTQRELSTYFLFPLSM